MNRHRITSAACGLAVAALGVVVLCGWLLRSAALLQVVPASTAMVSSTALCFVLVGMALALPLWSLRRGPDLAMFLALLAATTATACLLQDLVQWDLGVDIVWLHSWLADGNPHPGRMAPNTALGFIATGLALSQRVDSRARAIALQLATFGVLALGLTGLVGYSLQLDLLYPWFRMTRMAVPTAVAMTVVGVGLWTRWLMAGWYQSRAYLRDDEKIAFIGTALLVLVGLTTGIAGFAIQQATLERTLSANLNATLEHRTATFRTELLQKLERARSLALRPQLAELVQALNDEPDNALQLRALKDLAASVPAPGTHFIAVYDRTHAMLAQIGEPANRPQLHYPLAPDVDVALLWQDALYMRSNLPLLANGAEIGSLVLEERMPQVEEQLMVGAGLGTSGETGMCFREDAHLRCFPQSRNPQVYEAALQGKSGQPTPMSLAVQGKTGIFKGLDYRGNNVIGAHGPLTAGGLGFVVKEDTAELFAPIREQLRWYVPLLLLSVAGGALLLRRQLQPVAAQLLDAAHDARLNELRTRTVLRTVSEGIVTSGENGLIQTFNPVASQIFGYSEAEIVGHHVRTLLPVELHAMHAADRQRFFAGQGSDIVSKKNVQLSGITKDGRVFPLELSVSAVQVDGQTLFVGIVRDVTSRREAAAALFAEKERLRVTLGSIGDGVITTDVQGQVSYLNPVAEAMTGWTDAEARGRPLPEVFNIVDERSQSVALNPVEVVLRGQTNAGQADNTALVHRDGRRFAIEDSAAAIRDIDQQMIGVVLVFRDVSESRRLAHRMTHQATHDALTGLFNRQEFERQLELLISSGQLEGKQHTLLYLDLDQFKIVNDSCGHAAGDELLRQLTAIMQTGLRQRDSLARLGGDEFGVLLESCPAGPAMRIAEGLRQTVKDFRFMWQGKVFPVGVSIGMVAFGQGPGTMADVLRMADAACFIAKDKGRNRIHVHTQEDADISRRQGEVGWVERIQRSLDEGRFVLCTQKIQPLGGGDDAEPHFEVLVRMLDDDGQMVAPMAFIPAAERYGLMPAIDRWVISTALAHCAQRNWGESGRGTCSINLSGTSVGDDRFLAFVLEQFEATQVPPSRICFEITETAAITNLARAAALIHALRGIGCRFSLDDFGSGMSSFAYLKHLPVDYLKIDGGFVKDMLADPIDCAMVEAIHHIGQVMGIQTIAEFVENDGTMDQLRRIGVNYAQGYGVEQPRSIGS